MACQVFEVTGVQYPWNIIYNGLERDVFLNQIMELILFGDFKISYLQAFCIPRMGVSSFHGSRFVSNEFIKVGYRYSSE